LKVIHTTAEMCVSLEEEVFILPRGMKEPSQEVRAEARMGEGLGVEWIHVYVWLSHFAAPLKLSQHC